MIETLLARLGLDTTGFKAELKSAHSAFSSFARQLGLGLSIAGLGRVSREIVEYGSRIQDLAERFNVSTTALQQFGNAAELNGSSLEGMAKGFNKLAISVSQALGGNEQIVNSFAALGITLDDLRSLSPEELMLKIGKSTMNAADFVKVFGRNANELRPVLAGLADGTIELSDAIDADLIRKLDEADDALRSFWQGVRIYGASALVQIADEIKFIAAGITGMFTGMREVALAEGRAIAAALTGNFAEVKRQAAIAANALQQVKDSAFGSRPNKEEGGKPAGRSFAAVEGEGTSPASRRAAERAAKQERERHQLSLKELAAEGPRNFSAVATPQMMWAANQARLVEELEAQIRQYRLTGISYTGETPEDRLDAFGNPIEGTGLISRANAIRQTLPIKESEKEVGIYRDALDSSERLKSIEEKLDHLDLENQ
jgi:hypothetical protein